MTTARDSPSIIPLACPDSAGTAVRERHRQEGGAESDSIAGWQRPRPNTSKVSGNELCHSC